MVINMKTKTTHAKAKIGVLGGDRRQIAMAEELAACGFEVAVTGFDRYDGEIVLPTRCIGMENAVKNATAIVLPLPYSHDAIRLYAPLSESEMRLRDLFGMMTAGQTVIGGRFNDTAISLAEKAGVTLHDYATREEFNVENAVPTAEGAIAIAMDRLDITLHGSRCLVLGYGRIGSVLCRSLSSLGAQVSAAARNPADLARIRTMGYCPVPICDLAAIEDIPDVIFNTVPDTVINRTVLERLGGRSLIIDLASKPGGVDRRAAQESGTEVIWALSLPGKASPVTAGKIIARSVLSILYREGVLPT